jgi:hypothetical protein
MMNVRSTTMMMVGFCAALAASAAWADGSPFVGRWHWNRAQSNLPPGVLAPKDIVNDISRADGNAVEWSATIVTPDDQPHVVTLEGDGLGGDSRSFTGGTTASAWAAADTLQIDFTGPAGQKDAQTCTVSADQRRMTCRGVLRDGEGHTVDYVAVYDRM